MKNGSRRTVLTFAESPPSRATAMESTTTSGFREGARSLSSHDCGITVFANMEVKM